jgi:hypothetical protein
MTEPKLQAIYLRSQATEVPKVRFEGDLFGRKKLAEQLTGFLTRLPDGAVIAIDSPWGEGKTWFGKRWCATLNDGGFKTAYIDCFQRDHLDDPFTMIAGEFVDLANASKLEIQKKVLDTVKKLGVALLPAATKLAINTLGHWAIGNAELSKDITKGVEAMNASTAGALENLVESRLLDYQASNKSVDAFKASLAEMAAESEKPIVIFIDELDRCRPDFAVRTIERIKHFFDVPGVIFVLLLNRSQLVAAVKGLYGTEVDAESYLSKFIPISLSLPKRISVDRPGDDDNQKHCQSELTRFGFPLNDAHQNFSNLLSIYASHWGFSLRDVERAVVMYSFAQPLHNSSSASAWPIAIKLKYPALHKRLCRNDPSAHREAREHVESIAASVPELTWMLDIFEVLHRHGETQFKDQLSDVDRQKIRGLEIGRSPKDFLTWLFRKVDLTVEA